MIYILPLWNIIVMIIYATDKLKSKTSNNRVSEKTLLISAFCLGGIGALCGMCFFHHKTKHIKFKILVPVAFIITVFAFIMLYSSI